MVNAIYLCQSVRIAHLLHYFYLAYIWNFVLRINWIFFVLRIYWIIFVLCIYWFCFAHLLNYFCFVHLLSCEELLKHSISIITSLIVTVFVIFQVNITEVTFFENLRSIRRYKGLKQLAMLRQPTAERWELNTLRFKKRYRSSK